MKRRRSAPIWLALFLIIAAVDLIAELARLEYVSGIAQVLLMPLLAGFLLAARGARARDRLTSWVLVALIFSWLGDAAGFAFVVKLIFFLGAQSCYIAAFWPCRKASVLPRPRYLIGYVLVVAGVIVLIARESGALLLAVVIYGASVGMMAVLATGLNRTAAIGGAIFIVSDAILALSHFASSFAVPQADFLVMSSYLTAQTLLVLGALQQAYGSGLPRAVKAQHR